MDRHRETFSTCARLLLIGLLASCASLDAADPESAAAAAEDDTPRVAEDHAAFAITEEGPVRGVATDTTLVFRGIPYAAPPVGALRWRPPQRVARHRGVLDATRFANHCPQIAGAFGQGSTTEDCLFLNVFAPNPQHGRGRDRDRDDDRDGDDDGDRFGLRPVMVWIHGGALVTGESDDYDATRLVEQGDVIVVTINYRLGALGFTAHPALTAESPDHASGNYGLMDQQEALRWVRRNILLFGGDPFRVTIFGESAGGLSVHSQLASPGSAGLFQRAIVESGAYQLTQPALATVEAAGTAFATRAGCTDQTAACLRALTVEQVLANQGTGLAVATPVIDNKFLPLHAKLAQMSITQKIRRAMIGTASERSLLVRDKNKLVASAAIRSPKIQENEILMISMSRNVSDDVLRIIANNREWTQSHQVKLNLVANPRTPFVFSAKLIGFLREHELKALAKSKNVSGAIAQAARQQLNRKGK